jgi:hypothetical protein
MTASGTDASGARIDTSERVVALERLASKSAALPSTLPRGSKAGEGQIWATVRRSDEIKSLGRAPAGKGCSSWHSSDPATINT